MLADLCRNNTPIQTCINYLFLQITAANITQKRGP